MTPLSIGSTIGIIGGGQLGRMLSNAAAKLGFDTSVYSPEANSPAARVTAQSTVGAYEDLEALRAWASDCDVITYEFENVPTRSIQALSEDGMIVRPGAKSLEIAQDRVIEKRFLHACGIQTAEFFPIESVSDLESGIKKFGGVGLLKTRRDGYDGKGQTRISPDVSAEAGFDSLGRRPCILEALVPFSHEISVIVARSANGAHRTFDVPRNEHVDGILKRSTVPSGLDPVSEAYATDAAIKLADALEHVGVLALECFVLEDGTVVANEFAPRVHNSGHWTVEACRSSQFTQHILAVAGWPLAPNHLLEEAEMVNLIGSDVDDLERLVPDAATLTLYGKRAARPGRKMGHWVKLGALP